MMIATTINFLLERKHDVSEGFCFKFVCAFLLRKRDNCAF